MALLLAPQVVLRNIFEITPQALQGRGITLLLADLDNTLIRYGEREPTEPLRAWAAELKAGGVDLFLLSNSRKPTRASHFAQCLGIPFLGHAGKPKKGGFQAAMVQMGRTPAQTAMVGDQMFTDILGARRAGVLAIAVRPIACDNPFRALRYGIELPFRGMVKERAL